MPSTKTKLTIACAALLLGVAAADSDQPNNPTDVRQSKAGFFGGNTIVQLAQDLLARSTTSSQVLSLNLTNLVILLVVKALIFGAGSLGFGGAEHAGRSVENDISNESLLSQSELMLMLSYMNGAVSDKFDCLNAAACQDPKKAKEYWTTSNFIVRAAKMFNFSETTHKYEKMLEHVEEAIRFGAKGYDCNTRYKCQAT